MKQAHRLGIRSRHPDAFARATTAAHIALAMWFAYWAWQTVAGIFTDWPGHLDTVGIDGRLYYRAAATFVAGGDPWTAASAQTLTNTWPPSGAFVHFLFTGPPPTVLAFVPFVLIPEWIFVPLWMALTVAAAVYTIRRLGLPMWWLLFPPLVSGISVGNPHVVSLALLLCGSSWLRSLAAPLKAYAVIPMIGERQWRALAVLIGGVALSVVVFWPLWRQYVADYAATSSWIVGFTNGGFSAARDPRLLVVAVIAIGVLALVDRRAAGWLAVPALWPATQYFYSTFALPLRSPWLAAMLAVGGYDSDARVPWAIVAYAIARVTLAVVSRRRANHIPAEVVGALDEP